MHQACMPPQPRAVADDPMFAGLISRTFSANFLSQTINQRYFQLNEQGMHARMADSELMMDGCNCNLSLHGQRCDRVAHIDGAGPPPHAQSPNHTPAIDSDEINHPDKRNKTLI